MRNIIYGEHDSSIDRLEINGKVESTEMYSCKKEVGIDEAL